MVGPAPKIRNYWTEAAIESQAFLVFERYPCLEGPACFSVVDWHLDPYRSAQYWLTGRVRAQESGWASGQRKGAITHETGHSYGLHERYRHTIPSTCNDSELTNMDTNKKDQNGNEIIPREMCDGISPFSVDLSRATDYWSQGRLDDWTVTTDGGTVITFAWKDYAWAEGYQSVHYCHEAISQERPTKSVTVTGYPTP